MGYFENFSLHLFKIPVVNNKKAKKSKKSKLHCKKLHGRADPSKKQRTAKAKKILFRKAISAWVRNFRQDEEKNVPVVTALLQFTRHR